MKKEDLKAGYLVETRNKRIYMVMPYQLGLVLTRGGNFWELSIFDENLFNSRHSRGDIMKIWGFSSMQTEVLELYTKNRGLLWERKEPVHDFKVGDWVKMVEKGDEFIKADLDKRYNIVHESEGGYVINNFSQMFPKHNYSCGKWVKVDKPLYFDARKTLHLDRFIYDERYLKCHGLTREETIWLGTWGDHMFTEEKPEPLKIINGGVY